MFQKKVTMPADRRALIERANSGDEGCIAVGGLAAEIGLLRPEGPAVALPRLAQASDEPSGIAAIARLVQLARRSGNFTEAKFAEKIGITESELEIVETGAATSEPRVLYSLSQVLNVSYQKLLILAGHRQPRDEVFQREALRYAASSGSMDDLSKVEEQALHDLLKILHE